jgi:hypothetical protein
MTKDQYSVIHIAAKAVGLNESQYRTLLRNVAGVESSKQLDNARFEDVMATLEDLGFGARNGAGQSIPSVYWRNKVRDRGGQANARMIHLIRRLAPLQTYNLAGLVGKASGGRTGEVEMLYPREAWKLIEQLKAIVSREEWEAAEADQSQIANRKSEIDQPCMDGAASAGKEPPPRTADRGHEARLF